MSKLLKRIFNSSNSPSSKSSSSPTSAVDHSSSSSSSSGKASEDGTYGCRDEQKRKKLLRRLALAEADPEPLLDLTDFELTRLPEQVLTLVKVYHKRRLHLERNALPVFAIPSSSNVFSEVTVLHLEENALTTFHLDSPAALANLKELYLSGNRLTTLPPALCSLPRLQVLALRSNQLTTFPESLLTSASLTYLDLAYNRVEALPVEVLLRADPPALATLLLEGNPLQRPPIQCLQEEGESGSSNELVTGFAQIDARLRRYYQVESGREGGENAGDEGKMTEEKEIKSKRVQQQQTCDTSVTAIASAAAEDEGEDEDDEDDEDVSYNNEADDLFARYAAKKSESKRNAIEWERAYQEAQIEPSTTEKKTKKEKSSSKKKVAASGGHGSRLKNRDRLLDELYGEQEALFAKINLITERKDAEKQRVLDSCIEQLQEHSSLLIEKLQTEQKNKRAFAASASAEDDEYDQELNGDIGRLLAQYDAGLSQRRQELLNGLVEGAEEEDVKLAATVRRKDDQHQSRTRELERQDQALSSAFEAVLAARDRRNGDLTERISLVETELMALSFVERERAEARTGDRLAQLTAQRKALAALLGELLEEKRGREKRLMATLETELERRFNLEDHQGSEDESWLEQFQRLLARESFPVQVASYGVDARVADVLVGLYHELEQAGGGSVLQGKLLYYLGHFVDVPVDRLLSSFTSAADLLRLNIDDYELCQLLVERFKRYRAEREVEKLVVEVEEEVTSTPAPAPAKALQEKEEPAEENKFWYEAECVICLDNSANIVFLPCGHICTCQRCIRPNASALSLCPLCRAEIDFMQAVNIATPT
ncbi:E3 ubiquitin-protein ligase lrsam1 [Tyrophagus putrescentiae]|nr:E3 ubiquitin-protein ligase lrsam1 [Tyrophagus putrescentiae]